MEAIAHDTSPDEQERVVRRRWRAPFTWTGLLALGWVLYELTAQPALGAIAVCLKFGWDDFRTAFWLRRRDPHRPRGKACFWLYIGNGLLKTAAIALVMSFAMVVVAGSKKGQQGQRRWGRVEEELIASAMLTFLFGFVLAALATLCALWLAWRHRLRLWLHSAVHRACWADAWPPQEYAGGRSNRMGCLLLSVLLVVGLPLILFIIAVCAVAGNAVGAVVGILFAMSGCPVLLLLLRDSLHRHLLAGSPAECWNESQSETLREPEVVAKFGERGV